MSYHMYTTEALVCGAYNNNGADRSYLLFTEQLGMIYATARSVREERSRQRYALQEFSCVTVSLIRGKSGWRIGSVDSLENFYHATTTRSMRGAIVRIVKIVRQYIQGEEIHPQLYRECTSGLRACLQSKDNIDAIATTVTARLLYQLGYIAPPLHLTSVFTEPISPTSITTNTTTELLPLIETALTSSHL